MIVVSLLPESTETLFPELDKACEQADLVEVRLDRIPKADPARILRHARRPLIFACRPAEFGGRYTGDEAARLRLLQDAARSGAAYVDAELERPFEIPRQREAKLILSYHNWHETPAELSRLFALAKPWRPDLLKVVTTARTIEDNLVLARAMQESPFPSVFFPMGEDGLLGRVLYRRLGSLWTYACLTAETATARGQVPVDDMRHLYGADRIGPNTELYGVIGNPIAQSPGPEVFNRAFRQQGIDAVYLPLRLEKLEAFPRLADELGLRGVSVTIPHKEAIRRFLTQEDESTRTAGAANTLLRTASGWQGFNTDAPALRETLEEGLHASRQAGWTWSDLTVGLLGAGGAARAGGAELRHAGASVWITSRTPSRTQAAAAQLGVEAVSWENRANRPAEVLVQATPVGMFPHPEESAFPAEGFRSGQVALDLVTTPRETRFLREARAAGCHALGGWDMYGRQAKRQLAKWFDRELPIKNPTTIPNP